MRIAMIGGDSEDERHLARLAEKTGSPATFVRPRAGVHEPSAHPESGEVTRPSALTQVIERLWREATDEPGAASSSPPVPLRALVFEALEGADAAARLLGTVRRDAYFERIGALLILSAQHASGIRLPGGFDDFVLYPCRVEELAIRVRALWQRPARFGAGMSTLDTGVVVDETSRDIIIDGRAVQLTAREFALLMYLCEWRGKVLSREHLLARVWGSRYSGGRRTVDIHVRRLRVKLGASLAIETLRGSGYRLRRDPPSNSPSSVETTTRAFTGEIATPYSAQRSSAYSAQMPEPFSNVS
jgi:DNA-binding winged helix-turn-helix (wHTH) protein